MITVIRWLLMIIGIVLSMVSIYGMISNKTTLDRAISFISGLIYMCAIYVCAFDLFIG